MATQLLAIGTTAASSSDLTVVAGTPVAVSLKGTGGGPVAFGARVQVELKDDGNNYIPVDELTFAKPSLALSIAGVYRFTRISAVSCGVFSA